MVRATARALVGGFDAIVDRRIQVAEIAAAQHGVITTKQALELGLSTSAIFRLVSSGTWLTVFPGTHRLCEVPPTWEQSMAAACLWGGPGSVASHRAAVRLHGLGLDDAPPEIYIPTKKRAPGGLKVHNTDLLPAKDITRISDIPVTTVSRTLIDLGGVVPRPVVERVLETSLRGGLTSLTYLSDRIEEIGRPGRRGLATIRALMRVRDPRLAPTESELETMLWQLICNHSLPLPQRQFQIYDAEGFVGRVDFAFPRERLVVEAIGLSWHSGDRVLRDVERRNRLILAGWRVLEFPWRDVVRRGAVVAARIRAALSASTAA